MTELAFHFNAPDRIAYACRLLRKALASGAKVVVTGTDATLSQLDVALWTFSPAEFLPHATLESEASVVKASPVFLASTIDAVPHQQILLNLGPTVPKGFERFERVIEVVSLDDDERSLARGRWKHYTDLGYAITRHDLNLKA